MSTKPCTINPSVPCLLARSGKGPLVMRGNIAGCCSGSVEGKSPLCEARTERPSSIREGREDEESFWRHEGAQRVPGRGRQPQLAWQRAMEVLGDTTLVVWAGTCGEDLGMCRWGISKEHGVTGHAGEHRIHVQGHWAFTNSTAHRTVGFVLFGFCLVGFGGFFVLFLGLFD